LGWPPLVKTIEVTNVSIIVNKKYKYT